MVVTPVVAVRSLLRPLGVCNGNALSDDSCARPLLEASQPTTESEVSSHATSTGRLSEQPCLPAVGSEDRVRWRRDYAAPMLKQRPTKAATHQRQTDSYRTEALLLEPCRQRQQSDQHWHDKQFTERGQAAGLDVDPGSQPAPVSLQWRCYDFSMSRGFRFSDGSCIAVPFDIPL
jgi:hypothetical protein